MAEKTFGKEWTGKDTFKSVVIFFLHFTLLILIAGGLLLGPKLPYIREYMKERGADYLYALFSVFMLTVIMFFYFYFENKEMLSSGRNISLIFTILEV